MSLINPSTPPRLAFDEPESEVNARFTATPVDSPRFTFQNLVRGRSTGGSSTPSRYSSSTPGRYRIPRPNGWASPASTASMYDRTPNRTPKMCMHGATCVKYGCTFAHPPCRPQDCPEGENCLKVKCLLHHPRSRPIPQYKVTPDCRYGVNCTKNNCPFNHPAMRTPLPPPDESAAHAYSGYQVGQQVEAQCTEDDEWKSATVRRIRGAKLTLEFAGSADLVDVPRTRVRDPDDPDKEAAVIASENALICEEIVPSMSNFVKVCMHGAACVKYGCTFAHPPGRPADCPEGEKCTEVKCPLHHPRTRPLPQYKPPVVSLPTPSLAPAPATPRPAVMSPELEDLHLRKVEAIEREDYMEAQQIKLQMIQLVKLEKLARQKQTAVHNEDYLLAMELKGKLAEAQAEYDAEFNDDCPSPPL